MNMQTSIVCMYFVSCECEYATVTAYRNWVFHVCSGTGCGVGVGGGSTAVLERRREGDGLV